MEPDFDIINAASEYMEEWTPPVDSAHQIGLTMLFNDVLMAVRGPWPVGSIVRIIGNVFLDTLTINEASAKWMAPLDSIGIYTLWNNVLMAVWGASSGGSIKLGNRSRHCLYLRSQGCYR